MLKKLFRRKFRKVNQVIFYHEENYRNDEIMDEKFNVLKLSYFEQKVKDTLLASPDKEYILLCTSIPGLQLFNDSYGHSAGDKVLESEAQLLKKYAKDEGIVGYFGHDHLLLFMEKQKFDVDAFSQLCLNENEVAKSMSYSLRLSDGLYEIKDNRQAVRVMIDRALMAAEQSQKSGIVVYKEEMLYNARKHLSQINDLQSALKNHEFVLYLQPQFDVNMQVIGCEALTRWNHPTLGILPPSQFIQLAEETNLIGELDLQVWRMTAETISEWKKEGKKTCPVSINISPLDLLSVDVISELTRLMNDYQLTADDLALEITETVWMSQGDSRFEVIQKLKELGFRILMDDFGSGYSSLASLGIMELDEIKLDYSFLQKMKESRYGESMFVLIYNLAQGLNIPVLVEGVETKEQFEMLKEIGYTRFQGFYLSEPVSKEQFREKYMKGE